MARKSAPPSRRWVAKECRRACGWTAPCVRGVARPDPAGGAGRRRWRGAGRTWRAAARAAVGGARQRGPAALEIARDGAQRGLAGGTKRVLTPCPPRCTCFGIEVDRLKVQVHELLRAQAAAVGELEHRAVAQLERRGGRDAVQQRRDVLGLERARQPLRLLRRGQQVRGVGAASRRARPCDLKNERIAASLRATVRGPAPRRDELGGVAAQRRVVDVGRARRRWRVPRARAAPRSTP